MHPTQAWDRRRIARQADWSRGQGSARATTHRQVRLCRCRVDPACLAANSEVIAHSPEAADPQHAGHRTQEPTVFIVHLVEQALLTGGDVHPDHHLERRLCPCSRLLTLLLLLCSPPGPDETGGGGSHGSRRRSGALEKRGSVACWLEGAAPHRSVTRPTPCSEGGGARPASGRPPAATATHALTHARNKSLGLTIMGAISHNIAIFLWQPLLQRQG